MPDGVLDQRLNQHRRNANLTDVGGDVVFDDDSIAGPRALQFQIRSDRGEFFAERRHSGAARAQRVAEHAGELENQFLGAFGLYGGRLRDDVERIEQK